LHCILRRFCSKHHAVNRLDISFAYEPDKNYERDYERTCGQNYFVIHYNEIVQRISTEIDISECYDGAENHEIKKAVWDTGATTSVISESLARKFGLRSIGHGNIVTSIGQREVPIFELDIHLTRNITLKRVLPQKAVLFYLTCFYLLKNLV
jgi:hypothetical protein